MKELIYLIGISFLFCSNNLTEMRKQSDSDLIIALKKVLFETTPPNTSEARKILSEVRKSRKTELVESLEVILDSVKVLSKNTTRYVRNHYPVISETTIDIEATILYLELLLEGITLPSEQVKSLLNGAELKMSVSETPNAEIFLINENATIFTPYLIERIGNTSNRDLKLLIITSLRYSSHSGLEDFVWSNINDYDNDFPIYGRLISILGSIGNTSTALKLNELLQNVKEENKQKIIKLALGKIDSQF